MQRELVKGTSAAEVVVGALEQGAVLWLVEWVFLYSMQFSSVLISLGKWCRKFRV